MNQVEKPMQKIKNSRATSPMATYATNAQCIGALRYKAALGAVTEETGEKMDKCVVEAVRAKARQCRQVHGDIVFMKTVKG
jgi:hypothetical protein